MPHDKCHDMVLSDCMKHKNENKLKKKKKTWEMWIAQVYRETTGLPDPLGGTLEWECPLGKNNDNTTQTFC